MKRCLLNGGGSYFIMRMTCGGEILDSRYGGWCGLERGGGSVSDSSIWWKDHKKVCGENNDQGWFDRAIQ